MSDYAAKVSWLVLDTWINKNKALSDTWEKQRPDWPAERLATEKRREVKSGGLKDLKVRNIKQKGIRLIKRISAVFKVIILRKDNRVEELNWVNAAIKRQKWGDDQWSKYCNWGFVVRETWCLCKT